MNFLELINDNLQNFPERNALYIEGNYFTNGAFVQYVGKIQSQILNGSLNNPIGVVANDDIETYASILAILLSGYGYVVINPKNPIERNFLIIQSSGLNTIFSSDETYANQLKKEQLNIVFTKGLQTSQNFNIKLKRVNSSELAYLLYTSGSTGIPKGVPITRKNFDSFLDSFLNLGIKINSEDRFLQMFDLTFDVSVATTLIPLCYGCCIYTVPTNERKYPSIYKILKEHKITVATLVPSLLSFFKPFYEEMNFGSVKYCIMTAEASYNEAIEEWSNCIPNSDIYNLYGPTEATIWCFEYKWDKSNFNKKGYNGSASIGKPMKNVFAILVDDNKNIIKEPGVKGELCLSGSHLTLGYFNNEERNNTAFENFKINNELIKYYKTGDLCYFDVEGDFMYCGRIDHQVQVQGFRVELSEIELPVRKQFNLANIAALPFTNKLGFTEIVLFVEKFSGDTQEIMEHLKTKIPPYMLPSKIQNLEMFPLNNSNKVDRKALAKFIS